MGQKRIVIFAGLSALPPIADIVRRGGNVRFVPKADSRTAANILVIRSPRGAGE